MFAGFGPAGAKGYSASICSGEEQALFLARDLRVHVGVAARNTNNVVVFDIDETTGRLSEVSEVTRVEEPEFAAIVVLPGS